MTDKEFKRLSRFQLIEIIYQLQLQNDKLTEQNQSLIEALEDKRIRISNAGSLAEAALEINDCLKNAQEAADQYLNEIKIMHEAVEAEKEKILSEARAEATAIISDAQKKKTDYEKAQKIILREIGQALSDKG